MNEGYYDPYPRLALDQPLVLVGHPGAGVDQIGRIIAGRTGLPFNDVERAAESMFGGSRSQIVVERGVGHLREIEAKALEQAILREPYGIVVMESGLLEEMARRRWLRVSCKSVYVRRPDESLLERIQQQIERAPGSLPEFLLGAPRTVEELQEYLAARESALEDVDIVLDAEQASAAHVASDILASLPDLIGLQRIAD